MIVTGIAPAAAAVGLVVIEFVPHYPVRLLTHQLLTRELPVDADGTRTPFPLEVAWLNTIHTEVATSAPDVIGVEVIPAQALRMARHLYADPVQLATAAIGEFCTAFGALGRVIEIPAYGHGQAPLGNYPTPLVSSREKRVTAWKTSTGSRTARLRPLRIAYDVARSAHLRVLNTDRINRTG